jgi:hypothetical protein
MVDIGVVSQLCNFTLPLFEKAYLGHQALFYFGSAINHAAYMPDAPRAELMNLVPGEKQTCVTEWVQPSYPTAPEHARLERRPEGHEASASRAWPLAGGTFGTV